MDNTRQSARHLIEHDSVTLERLWISYWSLGGSVTELELDAYLYGIQELPAFEQQVLAWALEELDLGPR